MQPRCIKARLSLLSPRFSQQRSFCSLFMTAIGAAAAESDDDDDDDITHLLS